MAGTDFYVPTTFNTQAYKVSYNRPVLTRDIAGGRDFLFSNEYPMIRFLERNGYDVSYFSGVDTARYGSLMLNHKVFLSVGHDEYWSGQAAGERRGGAGRGGEPGVLLRQRDLLEDPLGAVLRRDVDGLPDLGLLQGDLGEREDRPDIGVDRDVARPAVLPAGRRGVPGERDVRDDVPVELPGRGVHGAVPVLARRGSGATPRWPATPVGGSTSLLASALGYEFDTDMDNGFRPAGLIDVSHTVAAAQQKLIDYGIHGGAGHGDPLDDGVQGAEWGTGVLRRDDPVGVGSGRRP